MVVSTFLKLFIVRLTTLHMKMRQEMMLLLIMICSGLIAVEQALKATKKNQNYLNGLSNPITPLLKVAFVMEIIGDLGHVKKFQLALPKLMLTPLSMKPVMLLGFQTIMTMTINVHLLVVLI